MAFQITSVDEARSIVSYFESTGANMRKGQAAWGTAIFGLPLAIPGILVAIPPTAHGLLHTDPAPIGLLGTLVFGWAGVTAIKTVREYKAAKRYLAEHQP